MDTWRTSTRRQSLVAKPVAVLDLIVRAADARADEHDIPPRAFKMPIPGLSLPLFVGGAPAPPGPLWCTLVRLFQTPPPWHPHSQPTAYDSHAPQPTVSPSRGLRATGGQHAAAHTTAHSGADAHGSRGLALGGGSRADRRRAAAAHARTRASGRTPVRLCLLRHRLQPPSRVRHDQNSKRNRPSSSL